MSEQSGDGFCLKTVHFQAQEMRIMLSQDNNPSSSRRSKSPGRAILSILSATTLAFMGLLATTTQLQWKLPSLGADELAPVKVTSANTKATQAFTALAVKMTSQKRQQQALPSTRISALTQKDEVFQGSKATPTPLVPPSSTLRRVIKQPGNNIIIDQLPGNRKIPVSSDGMPEFYKVVLEPNGKMTELGLIQHKARANYGYDQQDIFTGEVPDGAYVIHCQRVKGSIIRPMCWRELQVSDDQWVQYRFPRAQLKDWWKIEQQVRANIG